MFIKTLFPFGLCLLSLVIGAFAQTQELEQPLPQPTSTNAMARSSGESAPADQETTATGGKTPPQDPLIAAISPSLQIIRNQGLPLDEEQTQKAVLEAILTQADSRGRLLSAEQYKQYIEARAGRQPGAGITLGMSNGLPRITAILPGTDAEAQGIMMGSLVLSINGEETAERPLPETTRLLKGDADNAVSIEIETPEGEIQSFRLEREVFRQPAIAAVEKLPEGITYMRLNGLYPGSGPEIRQAIESIKAQEGFGLLMDLREARGDDIDSVIEIARLFSEPGVMLFVYRDKDDQDELVARVDPPPRERMPLTVLINNGTADAAELLAAVLKGSTRGCLLIGEPTAGDPLLREGIQTGEGDVLYMVTRKLVVADGSAYTGLEQVQPDILVAHDTAYQSFEPEIVSEEASDEEREDARLRSRIRGDAALTRAIDILLGLQALNMKPGIPALETSENTTP